MPETTPGPLLPDHSDNGPARPCAAASSGPNNPRAGCAVIGAGIGAVIGAGLGADAEGLAGAGAGLMTAGPPGAAGGAVLGSLDGAKNGAAAGAVIGGHVCGQRQPLVPDYVAATGNDTPPQGTLTGSTDGLTIDEEAFVNEHLAKGDHVEVIPTGPCKTRRTEVSRKPFPAPSSMPVVSRRTSSSTPEGSLG